jgi:hypothetical protein
MIYKVWDGDSMDFEYQYLAGIDYNRVDIYIDRNGTFWCNAEPYWEIIWDLFDLPDWVEWVVYSKNQGWYGRRFEPKYSEDFDAWGNWDSNENNTIHIPFKHNHPDWKNSKMKRPGV